MAREKHRTERLNVRCTPEEKRLLFEKAASVGMTVSGFLLWEAIGEELGQMIIDGMERTITNPKTNKA